MLRAVELAPPLCDPVSEAAPSQPPDPRQPGSTPTLCPGCPLGAAPPLSGFPLPAASVSPHLHFPQGPSSSRGAGSGRLPCSVVLAPGLSTSTTLGPRPAFLAVQGTTELPALRFRRARFSCRPSLHLSATWCPW